MSKVELQSLPGAFGAVATNLSLERPLTPEERCEVEEALRQHGFLVLPGRKPVPAAVQARWAASLGTLPPRKLDDFHDDRFSYWHSDLVWAGGLAKYTVLHCIVAPERGGSTRLLDSRKLHPLLPPELIRHLEHSSRRDVPMMLTGVDPETSRPLLLFNLQPLVLDPRTGRRPGVDPLPERLPPEALTHWRMARTLEVFLDDVEQQAPVGLFYEMHWAAGNTLLWHNCLTSHRAGPFDADTLRWMRRAVVIDDGDSHGFERTWSLRPPAREGEQGLYDQDHWEQFVSALP